MKTVKCDSVNEIIIKNSRFITLLISCFDDTDINKIFEEVKIKYPKATHYCYAYITKSYKKASDDGEPGGTAGMPMLNVLDKEGMINTLAITIRYFGGIKLGAGGLVRAYSKSVRDAIINSETVDIEEGYLVEIKVNYDEQKNLDYILKDYNIVNRDYLDIVTYKVLVPKHKLDVLDNYKYEILKEEYIEKVL